MWLIKTLFSIHTRHKHIITDDEDPFSHILYIIAHPIHAIVEYSTHQQLF